MRQWATDSATLADAPLPALVAPVGGLTVATWNIAAPNNNPFEYWMNNGDTAYARLMADVEAFVQNPGDRDVTVQSVLGDERFKELMALMVNERWPDLGFVEHLWAKDYKDRRIVSGFLMDKPLGEKQLVSMPDRVTSAVRVLDSPIPVFRPTVVNQYSGSLASLEEWWPKWLDFMFRESLQVKSDGGVKLIRPCDMLGRLNRSKYPALAEAEEQASVPLQVLCQAIFDAVMVHMMSELSPDGCWQDIKRSIVDSVYSNKSANTLAILRKASAGVDIICLQEAAFSFRGELEAELGSRYHVVVPSDVDTQRDQNSMILLSKARFPHGPQEEVTADILHALEFGGSRAPLERGDLLAIMAQDTSGEKFLIASFHGDTNGLASKPVVGSLAAAAALLGDEPGRNLVVGTDANTYLTTNQEANVQGVDDFLKHCKQFGLRTCWPDEVPISSCLTTCHARTHLQSQLNKSVLSEEQIIKRDMNPKDHILVQRCAYNVVATHKDNTGERRYVEGENFPSMRFPSDHGLVSAVFAPVTPS